MTCQAANTQPQGNQPKQWRKPESARPQREMGGKGCKPNSVCPVFTGERIICLSGRYPEPVPLAQNVERAAPGFPIWPCTRWGFPCLRDCSWSGGLLPHLFTLTPARVAANRGGFSFCGTFRRNASRRHLPRVFPAEAGVTRHRALWCSDFPPPAPLGAGSDPPPFPNPRPT
jgi:hypothetical protein